MASLDDVLKGNLRGFRRETGQPLDEPGIRAAAIPVEEPAIDEVEPPQLYDERAEYRGFKVPAGMDAEQTERWFGAIDAREDEREAAEAEAEAEFEAESGFTTQLLGSLERTVMKDNPRLGAKAVEGLGRVAGSQAMVDFGTKTAAEFDVSDDPAAFSPRIESIYDAEGFQDYIDYAGSTLGQGLGTIGAMVAAKGAGRAVGTVAGLPFGVSGATGQAGDKIGVIASGFLLNYGDVYDTLVEREGLDLDDAAKYAVAPAAVMAGLDAYGLEKIINPSRDALSDKLIKRTAQLAIRGAGSEAITETAQGIVQEASGEISEVLGLATEDIELGERIEGVANAFVGSLLPGGVTSAVSGIGVGPDDDAPAPPAPPVPEEIVSANMEDVAAEVPDAATAGAETESEIAEARRLWQEMGIESPYFKRKFGNTKVVDDDGKPLAVFHGTSGDFDQFRPGAADSYFGSAIYTSSSVDDVNANYATAEGPDIKNRVEQAIDRIEDLDNVEDQEILNAAKRYLDEVGGLSTSLRDLLLSQETESLLKKAIEEQDASYILDADASIQDTLVNRIARRKVLGDEAFSVMKTYVNIENPVYLDPPGTKGRTTFDLEIEYDDDGDIVAQSGSVIDLLEAIDEVAEDLSTYQIGGRGPYSDDVDKLKTFIGENSIDGEIDALDLFEEVRGGEYYFESDTGGLENTEFIRQVFEKMGFDGIIANAYHFFGDRKAPMGIKIPAMVGVTPSTYHYMAFKPEQIKSATGNVGTFDPSGNILKQSEDVTPQTSEGQQYVGLGGLSVEEAIDASKSISTGVELAEFIIENADNKDYKEIAKRLIPHLEETDVHTLTGDVNDLPQWVFESEKQGTLSGNIVNSLAGMSAHHTRLRYAIKGLNISRPGDPYNDVFIRGRPVYSGANAETMLHELIHAATVRRQSDGNLAANEGTKLQKAASKIIQLRNDVVQVAIKAHARDQLDSEMESILVRATENDKEFIAYGMTNKKFQEFLMTIKSKNKSIWNRFVEAVAGLLGISKDNQTALSDLILATDELLSAPLDEVPLREMTESIEMMSQPAEDALPEDIEKKLNEAAEAGTITREEAMEARREWRNKGTDSSFFKKWFRDSVVVDSKGKPLRVLHGTASKFDVFSISGDRVGLLGQGVYTTLNEATANYYASPARNRGKEIVGPPDARYPVMGNVIPGYVSIQNPVFTKDPLDKKVVEEMKEWIETRDKGTIDVSSETGTISYFELLAQIEEIAYSGSRFPNVDHTEMQRVLGRILKSNGYDGVINTTKEKFNKLQKNDFEDAASNMHIVVFEANQFKSDIGSLGTFSRVDDEIFFQREEISGAATAGAKGADDISARFPDASDVVDGRKVINADNVPNMSSIDSSLDDYEILPGIREVSMDEFPSLDGRHYSAQGTKRIKDLEQEIASTGEITPLIVVIDDDGPYILEGATRSEALYRAGAKSFPAKVVIDKSSKPPAPDAATAGDKEEGNPTEELGPVILSQRVDSPVDTVVMYTDDVSRSKAELDRRREIRNKYEPLLFELMKLESEFYEKDDRSEEVKKLGYQYEDLLKQYAQIDDELFADEYDRFLKGGDFYYETMEEGLEDFDVDRGFEVMSGAPDIMMDIELRSTQEEMQRKRFDRMMERGGTLVDLAGKNSPINRLILQKAKTFNHPVQTVQLIESDKVQLQEDLSNVEELKEDGLISYLLYKELKGDVMLF